MELKILGAAVGGISLLGATVGSIVSSKSQTQYQSKTEQNVVNKQRPVVLEHSEAHLSTEVVNSDTSELTNVSGGNPYNLDSILSDVKYVAEGLGITPNSAVPSQGELLERCLNADYNVALLLKKFLLKSKGFFGFRISCKYEQHF